MKRVLTGLEKFLIEFKPDECGRLGLVANAASRTVGGVFSWDALIEKGFNLSVIFVPEHGLMASKPDGVRFADEVLEKYGIPVVSTYSPEKDWFSKRNFDVDTLVYDLQDVGARFYTFINVLGQVLELASRENKRLIILDRPNPVADLGVAGPFPENSFTGELAPYRIPFTYGLTPGELAMFVYSELKGYRKDNRKNFPEVVRMENYRHDMSFDRTGLPWYPTSPAMPSVSTTAVYPGTCFFEGTNISEGRGTNLPFEITGAPWIDAGAVAGRMNRSIWSNQFHFQPCEFIPASGKYSGERCAGLRIIPKKRANPVRACLKLISEISLCHPDMFEIPLSSTGKYHMDLLYGSDVLRRTLLERRDIEELFRNWEKDENEFLLVLEKYRIYP